MAAYDSHMKNLLRLVCVGLMAGLLSAPLAMHAETRDSDAQVVVTEITALLTEFLQRVDEPAMHARFWADDLVYTSGRAVVRTKAEILAGMAAANPSASNARTRYAAEEVTVRAYGEFAALTFRLIAHNPDGTTLRFRNSGAFLLRNGQWQVVTWQATPEPAATAGN